MKLIMESWRKFINEVKNKDGKEQGVDGKACWDGYRYDGTEGGKDKCVPMEEGNCSEECPKCSGKDPQAKCTCAMEEETRDTYDDEVENRNSKSRARGKQTFLGEEEIEESDSMPCNKPKRTPSHPKKSHMVIACKGGKKKTIRFGQQGVKTNQTAGQRKAFKSRHGKNIAKGKMSAAYWANKVKWSPSKTKSPSEKWVKGS